MLAPLNPKPCFERIRSVVSPRGCWITLGIKDLGFRVWGPECGLEFNTPPPLHRDYDRDPNIEALERRGFVNHGSPLIPRIVNPEHETLNPKIFK